MLFLDHKYFLSDTCHSLHLILCSHNSLSTLHWQMWGVYSNRNAIAHVRKWLFRILQYHSDTLIFAATTILIILFSFQFPSGCLTISVQMQKNSLLSTSQGFHFPVTHQSLHILQWSRWKPLGPTSISPFSNCLKFHFFQHLTKMMTNYYTKKP